MDNVILCGFMGSGKSTAGRRVATQLGLAFIDTDRLIELETDTSIKDLIEQDGEPAFRSMEETVIARCAKLRHTVIATGGGVLESGSNREALARAGTVIWLRGRLETLRARIDGGDGRPLWAGDVADLLRRRSVNYASADVIIDIDNLTPDATASAVIEALGLTPVDARACSSRTVRIVSGSEAIVSASIRHHAGDYARRTGSSRAWIITEPIIAALYSDEIIHSLSTAGVTAQTLLTPGTEGEKTIKQANRLFCALADDGANRDDLVIALGGGVVGDLAGFVSACYMRGTPFMQIPTTLLAAVDASVGGKTGVNCAGIKNLVGQFHQPAFVLTDPAVLRSLPDREYRSALAEVIKCGLGFDVTLLDYMTGCRQEILDRDVGAVTALIAHAIEIKSSVCRQDERESGQRMLLNLGHTVGHALEAGDFGLSHGEAVSLGLIAACSCSVELGYLSSDEAQTISRLLSSFGLPVNLHAGAHHLPPIMSRLNLDKKRRRGQLLMALPTAIGQAFVRAVPPDTVARAVSLLLA